MRENIDHFVTKSDLEKVWDRIMKLIESFSEMTVTQKFLTAMQDSIDSKLEGISNLIRNSHHDFDEKIENNKKDLESIYRALAERVKAVEEKTDGKDNKIRFLKGSLIVCIIITCLSMGLHLKDLIGIIVRLQG